MTQHKQPESDRGKQTMAAVTMATATMAYHAAKCLSDTPMTSVVDEEGTKPEVGPKEVLGSAILFAVAIELALNGLRMEEKKHRIHNRKSVKPKNAKRHDLSVIFGNLCKDNREAIAKEVAILGWRVDAVLDFHKAMLTDWRYPVNRISEDGALFWWGAAPLSSTFQGILVAWKKRYPRPERVNSKEDIQTLKRQMFTNRDEAAKKMNAAKITKGSDRN